MPKKKKSRKKEKDINQMDRKTFDSYITSYLLMSCVVLDQNIDTYISKEEQIAQRDLLQHIIQKAIIED